MPALLGAALIALIAAGQSLHDGSELRIGSDATLAWFVGLQAAAVALYFVAVARVLRAPQDVALWLVLAVALGMRAIPLASPAFLSSDLYRYIWDGRVQLAGINPYVFVPRDDALAALRDTAVFSHVNRAAYAHTIYPPAAELSFAAIAAVSQSPRAMRIAMVLAEAGAGACLVLALRRRRQPASRLLIYAWNPLTVWEFAGNGHVDALAIAGLSAALLAATLLRPALAGGLLAVATLVKFLPAIAAAALWRPRDWRFPAAFTVVVLALYALYAGAGRQVFGFLGGYAQEEGFGDGSGLWALAGLAAIGPLPRAAGLMLLVLVALVLGAASLSLLRRPARDPARPVAIMATGLMVAISPHYPWYYPWLAVPAVLAPTRAAIWLSAAALLLYVDPLHERFLWPSLVFVPALALLARDLRGRDPVLSPLPRLATGE